MRAPVLKECGTNWLSKTQQPFFPVVGALARHALLLADLSVHALTPCYKTPQRTTQRPAVLVGPRHAF